MIVYHLIFGLCLAWLIAALIAKRIQERSARNAPPSPFRVEDSPLWRSDAKAWADMRDAIRALQRSMPGDDAVWLLELSRYKTPGGGPS